MTDPRSDHAQVSDADYQRLLALRSGLRRFERWSAQQAEAAGLTPAQHQLLLAIRGHADTNGPTIGEVADYLLLQHHSVVGLIDRAEATGLVTRARDATDHRLVRLRLTEAGAERLDSLSALHLEELQRLAEQLPRVSEGLDAGRMPHGLPAPHRQPPPAPARVRVARVRDAPPSGAACRVLVDRLWPRGLVKTAAPFEEWLKEVAPSTELRRWYGHLPGRFEEFAERYAGELRQSPAREALARLRTQSTSGGVILVTATRDVGLSAAAVLQKRLQAGLGD